MNTLKCKSCGGSVRKLQNYYECEYCNNKWELEYENDINALDRASAWGRLREGDFENAMDLFDEIVAKEPRNHEGYWGRALARRGIIYVTDISEHKKVPTCNNITEESFINDVDVQKAIKYAPVEIAENYNTQATYIEKVCKEWLEKANKEPAYDVFISYKDSDIDNGLERTQDSIDAQDLYNALVDEGYKVFFSRISLRDKIAEQYEPYIYNALKTAKVMIVFGEKPEYFSSVWVKNEWSRYKNRIEKGEKHKNSLVVVYKNMNPNDLPSILKTRQCINASDMTFLTDLNRHIARVVRETKQVVQLEKIEIKGGQIGKKSTTIDVNTIEVREIGQAAIAETSISEKQSVVLMHDYIKEGIWEEAIELADDLLFNNPANADAIWCKLLAEHRVIDVDGLVKELDFLDIKDVGALEKLINCAKKYRAEKILKKLYLEVGNVNYEKILEFILPYSFVGRKECIEQAFNDVTDNDKGEAFKLLLNTLSEDDVNEYINHNLKFAWATKNTNDAMVCLHNVLEVDEGNLKALVMLFMKNLESGKYSLGNTKRSFSDYTDPKLVNKSDGNIFEEDVKNILKYTKNVKKEVVNLINMMCIYASQISDGENFKTVLRYYPGEISEIKGEILEVGKVLLQNGMYENAEYFFNLILSFEAENIDAYWGICLAKIRVKNEQDIISSDILLGDVSEFNKYLTLVDESRRKKCIGMLSKQKKTIEERNEEEKRREIENRERLEQEKERAQKELRVKRENMGCIWVLIGLISLPLILYFFWAIS